MKKANEIVQNLKTSYNIENFVDYFKDLLPKAIFEGYLNTLKSFSEVQFLPFKSEREIHFYVYGRLYETCYVDQIDLYFEKILDNNSRVDIAIEDVVGIEIKFNTDKNEMHRLTGQMFDYSHQFPYVIGIKIFDSKLITIDKYLRSKPPNSEYIVWFLNRDYKKEGISQKKLPNNN